MERSRAQERVTIPFCARCGSAAWAHWHQPGCPDTFRTEEVQYVRADLHTGAVEALLAVKRATGTSTEAHHLAANALHELGVEDFPHYKPRGQ